MCTIQVVLDENLLRAADGAAKEQKVNRSALIRRALVDYLRRAEEARLDARERRGYAAKPQLENEYVGWEKVASWPEL